MGPIYYVPALGIRLFLFLEKAYLLLKKKSHSAWNKHGCSFFKNIKWEFWKRYEIRSIDSNVASINKVLYSVLYKMKITNSKTITLDDSTWIPWNPPLAVFALAQVEHMAWNLRFGAQLASLWFCGNGECSPMNGRYTDYQLYQNIKKQYVL